MWTVLFARCAELAQFQAILEGFLVFVRAVVERLTLGAFQFDEIVLGHMGFKEWAKYSEHREIWQMCVFLKNAEPPVPDTLAGPSRAVVVRGRSPRRSVLLLPAIIWLAAPRRFAPVPIFVVLIPPLPLGFGGDGERRVDEGIDAVVPSTASALGGRQAVEEGDAATVRGEDGGDGRLVGVAQPLLFLGEREAEHVGRVAVVHHQRLVFGRNDSRGVVMPEGIVGRLLESVLAEELYGRPRHHRVVAELRGDGEGGFELEMFDDHAPWSAPVELLVSEHGAHPFHRILEGQLEAERVVPAPYLAAHRHGDGGGDDDGDDLLILVRRHRERVGRMPQERGIEQLLLVAVVGEAVLRVQEDARRRTDGGFQVRPVLHFRHPGDDVREGGHPVVIFDFLQDHAQRGGAAGGGEGAVLFVQETDRRGVHDDLSVRGAHGGGGARERCVLHSPDVGSETVKNSKIRGKSQKNIRLRMNP